MDYTKIDFINDLLASKKIHMEAKTKILDLAKKELKSFDSDNLDIKKRIESLENKIIRIELKDDNEVYSESISPDIIHQVNNLERYKSPKVLRDFLIEYNQDPILKYTCHTIDNQDSLQNILDICKIDNYDFEVHLDQIKKRYNNLIYKDQYKNKVFDNVKTLIAVYLGTYAKGKSWSNIDVKWNSPELKQWALENPGKVPNPLDEFQREKFGFQTIELKNGDTLTNLSELVIHFKNLFHFKFPNTLKNKLEETIFLKFDSINYNFSFASSFSNDMELFTYSDSLMQAFVNIINMSKKQFPNERLNIKLYLNYTENGFKQLKIVIMNSKKFNKHFNALKSDDVNNGIGRYGDDFTNLINKQINGLCNLYIRAEFEDQEDIGIANIWDGQPLEFKKSKNEIEGVEFILNMY